MSAFDKKMPKAFRKLNEEQMATARYIGIKNELL
jgi:hypothetical protein